MPAPLPNARGPRSPRSRRSRLWVAAWSAALLACAGPSDAPDVGPADSGPAAPSAEQRAAWALEGADGIEEEWASYQALVKGILKAVYLVVGGAGHH